MNDDMIIRRGNQSPTENNKDQFRAELSCYILDPPLLDETFLILAKHGN